MIPSLPPATPENPNDGTDANLSSRRANREQLRAKPARRSSGVNRREASAREVVSKTPVAPKPTRKRSVLNLVVMTIAAGLVATMALPAYAFTGGDDQEQQQYEASSNNRVKAAQAQDMTTASGVAIAPVSRDSFTATSPEELQRQQRAAAAALEEQAQAQAEAQARKAWVVSGTRQEGDDYPWWDMSSSVLSPLRYYYRECVDFVAWRINRDAGATGSNWAYTWGNGLPPGSAYAWARNWSWNSGNTAIAGSVAWYSSNHVAYVNAVNGDGTMVLEEYNWGSARHSYNRRVVSVNDADLFLYPPGVG